jgi:hypothetical protein
MADATFSLDSFKRINPWLQALAYLRNAICRLIMPNKLGVFFALFPVPVGDELVEGILIYRERLQNGQVCYRLPTEQEEADYRSHSA